MAELRPFPFCGSDAIYIRSHYYTVFDDEYYLYCADCWSSGTHKFSQKKAIEAWNRRAYDAERKAD